MSKSTYHNYRTGSELGLLILLTIIIHGFSLIVQIYAYGTGWNVTLVFLTGIAPIVLLWTISHFIKRFPIWLIMLISPFIAIGVEICHEELYQFFRHNKFSWQFKDFTLKKHLNRVYFSSLIYFAWLLGYFTITNHFRFVRESLAATEARTQAQGAQLAMLRYQINPHFLFNTLNSISALVLSNKNIQAEEMIGGLSRFLRYSLDEKSGTKITLQEEMDIVREYLSIEKIRFQDKLDITFNISPESSNCLVPSLILQPAIENAIKHAIAPMKSHGKILIDANIVDDYLNITITDNGPGCDFSKPFTGVGVKNMKDRIDVMYGKRGHVTIANTDQGGVEVSLVLPIERANQPKIDRGQL